MSQNLASAAVVIGALRVKIIKYIPVFVLNHRFELLLLYTFNISRDADSHKPFTCI